MSTHLLRQTWAEVNLGNFKANIRTAARMVPHGTGILAVVKANGYGCGAVQVSRAALQIPEVKGLAVATPEEAVELRDAGIEGMILVLGPIPAEACEAMAVRRVSIAVASNKGIEAAKRAGESLGVSVPVHLKIETGMGRVGVEPGPELAAMLALVKDSPSVGVEGVFTHFAVSDTDPAYTKLQMDAFERALSQLDEAGIHPRYRHAANSAAILNFPRAHLDLVRPGIMMYGAYPDQSLSDRAPILPVLSLCSRVSHVKPVPAGYSVGYGRIYQTPRPTTIATAPIGYADGYPRLLSGKGSVIIHGKRLPIAGRVCMDQIMVDAGDAPVSPGDLVTLIGSDGGATVTVDEVARLSGTIAHEVLTGLTARVPRLYVE